MAIANKRTDAVHNRHQGNSTATAAVFWKNDKHRVEWSPAPHPSHPDWGKYASAAHAHLNVKSDVIKLLSDSGKLEAAEDNVIECAQRIADQCLLGEIPFPYYMPGDAGYALAPHVKKAAYSLRHRRWIDRERHDRREKRGGGEQTLSLDAKITNGDDSLIIADTVQSSAELPCYSLLPLSAAASDDAAAFAGHLEKAGVPPSLFTPNELRVLHANWKCNLNRNASAISRALDGRLSHTTCRTLLASAEKKIREIL